MYYSFLWIKPRHSGAPSVLELTQIFEPQQQFSICPFISRSGRAQKRKCWCYAEWLDRIRSFPEEWDTRITGKSAFVTADLTRPKTLCVYKFVCVRVCVFVCAGGRADSAWHDSHRLKKPDRPAAVWVSPGRCSNSSRKLRECGTRKRNVFRHL